MQLIWMKKLFENGLGDKSYIYTNKNRILLYFIKEEVINGNAISEM